jgi:nucleotidyltransferase AbiEii toxin of type IV toxin-antitoxin system
VLNYPLSQPPGFDYLRRSVKVEFGSLTDQQPVGRHPVRPWLAEVLPEAFPDWRCEVVAPEVERSFWEKATILHAEYHRPAGKPTPERFSRHYADTAALARHPAAMKSIDQHALRGRVVAWKGQFFGSSWARYDLARPGTFRLVPPAGRLPALRRDYQAMRDMYLSAPADFDEVLAVLAGLEQRINGTAGGRKDN